MATIKIKRTSQFVNMARNYEIFIDGHFVGKIANGKTAEFPVTAGKHTVVAKIDWCTSPEILIEIGTDEIKHLTVGGFNSWLIFIPFFPIHSITSGRKKYLTLKETS